MPLWLIIALGAGIIYLASRSSTTTPSYSLGSAAGGAGQFYVGQSVNVAVNTEMYSDAALTQDAGAWPGGTATVKAVDTTNNSVGFVGPSGAGLGGGAPAYVSANAVSAA